MDDIPTMVQKMLLLPEADLAKMSHADLYMARGKTKNKEAQDKLASAEHRAFAREAVTENPALALPIALATPLYQLYKMIQPGSRSNASLDQALSGLVGVGEGIKNMFVDPTAPAQPAEITTGDINSTKG